MSGIYRILIADDILADAEGTRQAVRDMFGAPENLGAIDIVTNHDLGIGNRFDELLCQEVLGDVSCLLADLDWEGQTPPTCGFKLCQYVRQLSTDLKKDLPCYTILYSGNKPGELTKLQQTHNLRVDDTKYEMSNQNHYNMWWLKDVRGYDERVDDGRFASGKDVEGGISWHMGRHVRNMIKNDQIEQDSLLALLEVIDAHMKDANEVSEDTIENAEVRMADGNTHSAGTVFVYLGWGDTWPHRVAKEIRLKNTLNAKSDLDKLRPIIGVGSDVRRCVHVGPKPEYAGAEDSMRMILENDYLQELREVLLPISQHTDQSGTILPQTKYTKGVLDDLDRIIEYQDIEEQRAALQRRFGTQETLRFKHFNDHTIKSQRSTGVDKWEDSSSDSKGEVRTDEIPFKHMWRCRMDEFLHPEYADRFHIADPRDVESSNLATFVFRPCLEGFLRFWSKKRTSTVQLVEPTVVKGDDAKDFCMSLTFDGGNRPSTGQVFDGRSTFVAIASICLYAKCVLIEDSKNRYAVRDGIYSPEAELTFWDGFDPPEMSVDCTRISVRFRSL